MLTRKELQQNYQQIYQEIDLAKQKVTLIAVSKSRTVEEILNLYNLGQRDFGENYLQEAINKINNTNKLDNINWHYIGKIQSNKIKALVTNFNWIHSVDSFKIAKKISDYLLNLNLDLKKQKKLNILIQVNLEQDQNKAGIELDPKKIIELVTQINNLANPNLLLKGLMCILKTDNINYDSQYKIFKKLADLNNLINLDCLSMGMSNDYKAAIAAGSTMIRIGTKIFGARNL